MAFRFPGDLGDEAGLWQALQAGRDAVGEIGGERWATDELRHGRRAEPGRSVTFAAGVLSRVDQFDAEFFGISPREAAWLDPQQRLLLELAWEAMENGGHLPSSLAGSDCSVYVGISGFDYAIRGLDDLAGMSAHTMSGNTLSIAANRLSYAFDLRGPSLAVDTACSSSLVALHHACNSLRLGESSQALVGGVNLLLHPYPFVGFSKASMLSANGRCRAFAAGGDGYVRAEGGAVFLLKPLDAALAAGDDILALILASGANADGGRKTGITIPSREGQAELMRSVLARAGIAAADVDYVEAHGTGTAVGDPVEAAAIGSVYGLAPGRTQPLPIGSVKTNLGHLEPASGMAGLVKAILVLKNRCVPPSLHFAAPNPDIDFAALGLEVAATARPLVGEGRQLVAGVNSFGFGGANAHVLVQDYRHRPARRRRGLPIPPLFLSAASEAALRATAGRYAEFLAGKDGTDYYDLAYSAAFRRERLDCRLALGGADADALATRLAAFARGETPAGLVVENAPAAPAGVAFVYSGNGSQWLGMGRRLAAESPRFAALLAELEAPIAAAAGFSPHQQLYADGAASRLEDTAVAQPLLFAIQVALTTLLREWGIEPVAVAGHSVGEVAAAWAAGALPLHQAIELVCARSAVQALTRGAGRMAAVGMAAAALEEVLSGEGLADIEIAGFNSPGNLTVAGTLADLSALGRKLEAQGVFFRLLDLDYAFHSRHMDPVAGELAARLAGFRPQACAGVRFVSTVAGGELDGAALDAGYWWRNVREPVRFAEAVAGLADLGCRVFVEIGPHAILQRYLGDCLASAGVAARILPTLQRRDDGLAGVEQSALRVHLLAPAARREAFFPSPGRHVRLPNYPWQRERHWLPQTSEGHRLIERRRVHPLLGWRLSETESAWENVLDPATLPWLGDHRVGGAIVLPAAAYVEMALAAGRECFAGEGCELEDLEIVAPLVFDGEHGRSLRFELCRRDGGFRISGRQRLSDDEWTLHALGRLLGEPGAPPAAAIAVEPAGSELSSGAHYRLAAAVGLDYGPAFQCLIGASVGGETLAGRLAMPAGAATDGYRLHPALLDVCFQSLVDFFRDDIEGGRGRALLPVRIGRLQWFSPAPAAGFRARVVRRGARSLLADFELVDQAGALVARLADCRFKVAPLARQGRAEAASWRIEARPQPHPREPAELPLPPAAALAGEIGAWLEGDEFRAERAACFGEALPLLEALAVAFVYEAFGERERRDASWITRAWRDPANLPVPQAWFRRLAGRLRDEGLLDEADGEWRLAAAGELPAAQDIWLTVLRDFPEFLPDLALLGRVGRQLPALLAGTLSCADFVAALGKGQAREFAGQDSPVTRGSRLAIREILLRLAAALPAGRRLRALDVGAADGETARRLAAVLGGGRLEYVIADADPEALDRARAECRDDDFVSVAALAGDGLDLAAAAGLPERFDVVVLRDAASRAGDPARLPAAARQRLTAGGLLLLAERHPDFCCDLVGGLAPGWWRAGEAPAGRLLPPRDWEQALAAGGFAGIASLREPAAAPGAGSFLVLGRNPELAAAAMPAANAGWLLLVAGPAGAALAPGLEERLRGQGQRVLTVAATDDNFAAVLAGAQAALDGLEHIVYLAGGEAENASAATARLLALVQALAAGTPARLWLLTRGGALAAGLPGGWTADPAQAALWGFARVVMNEQPGLACTLIDVGAEPGGEDAAGRLAQELLYPDGEAEIILTAAGRYVPRMRPVAPPATPAPRYRLDFAVPGQLRNLVWREQPERPLQAGEIEVRPLAVGLNFRDLMYLMGLLPDEAVERGFAGASLGLEFAGVVTRCAAGVDAFAPGDAVMGFGPACFASHVITRADALAAKPPQWSFAAAATVPTAFFTVYYALKHLAGLQPGERVLIHGAAGGVGIAAVQLARHLGAEVYATAGSAEKRDFVHLLGADHVLDSRSLDFAGEILALTGGEGVDVVLNSLAGEAMRRSLRALKPFGRFLELGKRDFFENTALGLRPFKDNVSYFGIDADQLLSARPQLAAGLFRELMALFAAGVLFPLPRRVFPAERVVDAFRLMQQARHIGKVVLALDEAPPAVEPMESQRRPLFRREATYLVSGGVAGFGLAAARWLAEQGAGHLVLLGRRGERTPGAAEAAAQLQALGARVHILACDVAERGQLAAVLKRIADELPPLRGVLHAAMVIDDAPLAGLDAARLEQVLAPKARGAWNLHCLTRDLDLEHFILFSSITTFIGNPGQAAYVAANAYLEGLAASRRQSGLAATCIAWGPIGDAGYLSRQHAVRDALAQRLGAAPLAAADALALLGRRPGGEGTLAVADFAWPTLAGRLPSAGAGRFAELRRRFGEADGASCADEDLPAQLAGRPKAEIAAVLRRVLGQEVARLLGIGSERINPAKPLHELGMDSLMAVELALALEKRLAIRLPAMLLNDGPSLERLADNLAERLAGASPQDVEGGETAGLAGLVGAMAAQHGESLCAEEVAGTAAALRRPAPAETTTSLQA